jgi:hypothetical protein
MGGGLVGWWRAAAADGMREQRGRVSHFQEQNIDLLVMQCNDDGMYSYTPYTVTSGNW